MRPGVEHLSAFHLMSVGLVLYVNTGCHGVLSSSIELG